VARVEKEGRRILKEEQAAREDNSTREEDCFIQGPWAAKGNPPGFLDSDDEEEVDPHSAWKFSDLYL